MSHYYILKTLTGSQFLENSPELLAISTSTIWQEGKLFINFAISDFAITSNLRKSFTSTTTTAFKLFKFSFG